MALTITPLLQPASFRGIQFAIFDAEMLFGRRNVLHEYPYRDTPYGEDLGRKGREITLNAFLMILDFTTRNQLISAIEDNDTPGVLVHPTLGALTVIPKECKHRYNNMEGGIEYFTFTFVEAGAQSQTSATADTNGIALNFAATLKNDAVTFFSSTFKTNNLPNFISLSALHNVQEFSNAISQAANFGGAANDTSGAFTGFLQQLATFNANIPTLIFDPAALGSSIVSLNDTLNADFSSVNLTQATLIQMELWVFGDLLQAITDPTTLGQIMDNNQIVLIILVQLSVLAELIIIVTKTTFISLDQAIATQDQIANMADQLLLQLANAFDDTIYLSLTNAVDSMIANIQSQAATLAQVQIINIPQNTPALVTAYSQYGDASQDLALVAQNNIINPGFIPAGTQLAVLV